MQKSNWINISDKLPDNMQRVLAFLPGNAVFVPGKSGEKKLLEVIILIFQKDFFKPDNPKHEQFGAHFWLGEGQSNHYFGDVSHWMPMPEGPVV